VNKGMGSAQRFATLPMRNLVAVQIAHLRTKFELAERSILAERVAIVTNDILTRYEEPLGINRVKPGEMVIEENGQRVAIPLLSSQWAEKLANGLSVTAVKCHQQMEQYDRLRTINPDATFDDLWQLRGTAEKKLPRGPKNFDPIPDEPLSPEKLELPVRGSSDVSLPTEAIKEAVTTLVESFGVREAQAESLVITSAELREWCCPKISELKPGQIVWLARGTKKSRKVDPRLFQPVILTVMAPSEIGRPLEHKGLVRQLKMAQIERMTAEAWRQDGVLTNLDLEWILECNSANIRQLLEQYSEKHGIILPTAGTVLDMGRTLTHKGIVVDLSLSGMTTQQIARRIYHTPEAVDSYLRTFERVVLLRYYEMPADLIARVMGHGPALIKEHTALIDKHFPTREALHSYLQQRGVPLRLAL
jgi:CheY-like chemotaxis protein